MQGSFLPHPVLVHSEPAKRHYQAAENLTSAKHQQILQANKHRRIGTLYKVGQRVKLSTKNLPDRYHVSKISPRWLGPFPVSHYEPWTQNITLDFSDYPDLQKITNQFNTSLIAPFYTNSDKLFPGRTLPQPGPVTGEKYEVEKLLEFRSQPKTNKLQYLVKWEGWPSKHNQ